MGSSKGHGFQSCGRYYEMINDWAPYIDQLKILIVEIHHNALNAKTK